MAIKIKLKIFIAINWDLTLHARTHKYTLNHNNIVNQNWKKKTRLQF